MAYPWLFTEIAAVSSSATMITGPSKSSSPENVNPPSSVAPSNSSALLSLRLAALRPKAASSVSGVLQDRLASELRLAQADDIDSANAVLRKFIADYNRRFARQPRENQPAWRAVPESLERICCFMHERIVSNDNVVQWEGRRFQIPQQARRFSFAGAKVQIFQALNGRLSFYYGDTRLEHAVIPGG
jgi:hypothetical protein